MFWIGPYFGGRGVSSCMNVVIYYYLHFHAQKIPAKQLVAIDECNYRNVFFACIMRSSCAPACDCISERTTHHPISRHSRLSRPSQRPPQCNLQPLNYGKVFSLICRRQPHRHPDGKSAIKKRSILSQC